MTIGDIWAKVTNYRFSTHAFGGIVTAATATYLASPQLQDVVNAFTREHVKAALVAGAIVATWRNYAKAQRSLTMTTTIQPGETGASAALASATEEK
jgi:hypothetical protein